MADALQNTLQTYYYTQGDSSLIDVAWDLEAGQTYFLYIEDHQPYTNGQWTYYSSYPTLNNHIQVDGAVDYVNSFATLQLRKDVWYNFTYLTTNTETYGVSTVSVPGSLLLLGLTCTLRVRRYSR